MIKTELLKRADILIKNKEYASAEKLYLEVLAGNPQDDIIMSFMGRLYIKMKRYKSAERILEKAYIKRKTAPTIASLAFCKFKIKKYDDAIILYEELFKYDPNSIKIYEKIIDCFRALHMYNFSHAYAQKMYINHQDKEVSYIQLTQSYIDIGEIKQAEEMCAKTIQAFPRSGPAWIIAGNLQEYCYCNEEMAQTCYQTAIDYGYTFGYYHLAVSLSKVGRYKEAEECYKRLLEIAPDEDYVQAGLGMLYLTLKNMNGYEYFFKREKTDEVKSLKNPWHGQTLENERVLLYCDHGYGDIIQFIRYLPQLSKKINNIIVKTRPELMNLLRRSYPEDKYPNVKFISELSKEISYDKFVLSTDLPYYLNLDFNHIPYPEGYLTVDISKKNYFKEKYFNNDKLKVGLCWKAGGYGMRTDVNRTINIEYFDKILGINKVQFYSFQKNDIFDGCNKYSQITDLKEELKDFDDTASAISNLDLMITADTSCLHISGAIGKKTYLLLPYCADWRWFENDKTTEWYNSVEIFKQQDRQDWYIEADKIYERLKEIIG